MGRIIVLGDWNLIQSYMPYMDMSEIVCFADNYAELKTVYGKNTIRYGRINEFNYDYIVIFERENIDSYYNQLISLNILKERVVSWVYYIFFLKYKSKKFSRDADTIINHTVKQLLICNMLDIDCGMSRNGLFIHSRNVQGNLQYIDNYGKCSLRYGSNHYKNICGSLDTEKRYDAVCCLDYYLNHSVAEFKELIGKAGLIARYLFISLPFKCSGVFHEWEELDFSMYGKVAVFHMELSKLIVIDTYVCGNEDVRIYTVTHKCFTPPKSSIYVPIFAGKDNNEMGITGDGTGNSIAELNPLINECTSLYWIWKNTDSRYIGLNHYRRYFCIGTYWGEQEQNLLDANYIHRFLAEYDMIVAEACDFYPRTVSEALQESVNSDIFNLVYNTVTRIITEKYPGYAKDLEDYFNGYISNLCNMFITTREVMNRYCEWLFPIILEAIDEISLDTCDSYSRRMIGFMAERLLTLWIMHNEIKVKELPILFIDK